MPHQQNFPVQLRQLRNGNPNLLDQFPVNKLLARRRRRRGQLPGQRDRLAIRQRQFPHDASGCSAHMLPAEHEQAFVSSLADPQAERHRLPLEIVIQPAERLQLGFLNDIGGVDPRPEHVVQPKLNEMADDGAVPAEQFLERAGAAGLSGLQQPESFSGVGQDFCHGGATRGAANGMESFHAERAARCDGRSAS